jgi:hypothetical protein
MFGALVAFLFLTPARECRDDAPPAPVRVTVVVILATTENNVIDYILTDLAKEVRKREPKLIGFRVSTTEWKSIKVGDSAAIKLVDKQELTVKVEKPKGADGRVGLAITPPMLGEIKYTCACDKYLPVVTPHTTAKGETLILAVMAKPCTQKK